MTSLYTIGYEGLSLKRFLSRLESYQIEAVVDVRELPLSRKKGFSKTPLSKALESIGIQYSSVRSLGSPRPLRNKYKETKDWNVFSTQYQEYLENQKDALEMLLKEAYAQRVCLLCFEKDSFTCHRSIIATRVEEMASNGLRVRHL